MTGTREIDAPGAAPDRLEAALGYHFEDRGLFRQALLHRSYAHEFGEPHHNEPLEFLGDAVLGFLVAERIVRRRPDMDEGGMTRLRAALVNTTRLAGEARRIGLGPALLLGRGEENSGGREKPTILADGLEALIGAMFLDGGTRPVRTLVTRLFRHAIEGAGSGGGVDRAARDAKTELQERVQGNGWALPRYRLAEQTGPDHARQFVVEVLVRGEICGRGVGTSKKRAEQAAAQAALSTLD